MKLHKYRSSLFVSKIRSFPLLMRDLDRLDDKVKFGTAVFVNFLVPFLFRRVPLTMELRFKGLSVKYRVGQGELAPYLEITDNVLRSLTNSPEVKKWTIIDCGANIGLFCLFFKNANNIIAVEPNPECHERLAHNLTKNGVNGLIIGKAVSSREGDAKMSISNSSTGLSYISDDGNVLVETTTIDRIVADYTLDRVDLLKLDVEGHEIAALQGALDSCRKGIVKRVIAEFRKDELLDELDAFLIPLNYKRIAIVYWYNALYELQ